MQKTESDMSEWSAKMEVEWTGLVSGVSCIGFLTFSVLNLLFAVSHYFFMLYSSEHGLSFSSFLIIDK